MKDQDKTKKQLIEKLVELHKTVAILKQQIDKKNTKQYIRSNLVECLPADIIVTDLQGKIIDINKSVEQSTGYSRDELVGKQPGILNASDNVKKIEEEIFNYMKLSKAWSGEMVQRHKNGSKFLAKFNIFPVKDGNKTIAWASIKRDITESKRIENNLRESEKSFASYFNNTNDAIYVYELAEDELPGRFVEVNNNACRLLGYTRAELLKMSPKDIIPVKELVYKANRFWKTNTPFEITILSKDRSRIPVEISSHKFALNNKQVILSVVRDISARKRMEDLVQIQLAAMKTSMDGIAILNSNQEYIYINHAHAKIYGYDNKQELIGRTWKILYDEDEIGRFEQTVFPVLAKKRKWRGEAIGRKRNGTKFHQEVSLTLLDNGGLICVVRDITARKRLEGNLRFLSLHDSLTGLFNRAYFQQKLEQMNNDKNARVGIIVCDVDGLKLVNDTLGHKKGDELLIRAAKVLKESFSNHHIVARIGGDEFGILVPDCDTQSLENACQRIKKNINQINVFCPGLSLSMSTGFAVRDDNNINLNELFEQADNNMYREKLHHNQNRQNTIIQALNTALEAKDFVAEGHIVRLQTLVTDIASAIGLSRNRIIRIRLLAQFHDIGKVGIPDRILFKNGPLTPRERIEMQRHCEIGYRIANSAPDLAPVADWILKHHEWWNGEGYPLGLRGEEIPLECRILAIADAYDAMTSDRPYRKAISHEEALEELKKYANTQFDPQLVQIFLQIFR